MANFVVEFRYGVLLKLITVAQFRNFGAKHIHSLLVEFGAISLNITLDLMIDQWKREALIGGQTAGTAREQERHVYSMLAKRLPFSRISF